MSRFILRYTGQGPKPAEDVKKLLTEGQARLVDDSTRMVLVEGAEHTLQAAVDKVGDWELCLESKTCDLPDPHPGAGKVEKPPKR